MISTILAKPSTQAFIIFISALILYSVAPFRDFFRDEDYEMAYQTASFYRAYMPVSDGLGLFDTILYRVGMFFHSLFFYRHGAVPALYFSAFYALFDALGLPFSAQLLAWPTTVLGAASCVMLFYVFVRARLPLALCFAGGVILAVSPLFAGLSRGAGTYIWIAPVFSLLLCITALQRLDGSPSRQYFMAFALINLIFCDALFFLSFAALAVAYGLREVSFSQAFRNPVRAVMGLGQGLSPLFAPRVSVPVVLSLGTLILSAAFVVMFGHTLQGSLPLNSILLATGKHAGFALNGLALDRHWLDYPSVLLGEAAPISLIAAAIALIWHRHHTADNTFMWWVVAIAGGGFVALIYGVVPPKTDVTHGYQIYTLIPLVLFLILSANRIIRIAPNLKPWVYGIVWAHIVISGASTGAYLFKWPTAVSSVYDEEVFGVNKPDYGTKAAGYLARQILSTNIRASAHTPVRIDIFRDPAKALPDKNYGGFRVYSAPFMANAALVQNGDAYTHELGLQAQLEPRIATNERARTLSAQYPCPAELCIVIAPKGASNDFQIYDVLDDHQHLLARLYVSGPIPTELPPGQYETHTLNARFDQTYQDFEDFYPPRPKAKKERILQSLKGRLGL